VGVRELVYSWYPDSTLPNGYPVGTAEALDCAYGLYLNDPTAWLPE
jgi:hypothetical protein